MPRLAQVDFVWGIGFTGLFGVASPSFVWSRRTPPIIPPNFPTLLKTTLKVDSDTATDSDAAAADRDAALDGAEAAGR